MVEITIDIYTFFYVNTFRNCAVKNSRMSEKDKSSKRLKNYFFFTR